MISPNKSQELSIVHPKIKYYLRKYPQNMKWGKLFCAIGLWQGEIKIYDIFLHSILNIHTNTHGCESLLYMQEQKILINGSFEGKIQLFNLQKHKLYHTFHNNNEEVLFIERISQNIFATGGSQTFIRIWDIEKTICLKIIEEKIITLSYLEPILYFTQKQTFCGCLITEKEISSPIIKILFDDTCKTCRVYPHQDKYIISFGKTLALFDQSKAGCEGCISTLSDKKSPSATFHKQKHKRVYQLPKLIPYTNGLHTFRIQENGKFMIGNSDGVISIGDIKSRKNSNYEIHSNYVTGIELITKSYMLSASEDKKLAITSIPQSKIINFKRVNKEICSLQILK